MNDQPFFSVCIPNYNYAHYLKETVDSVLSQSFQDFEIIIVDNASTDQSWELMQSFNDPRIKVYKNEFNVGFAPNLQLATEKALGKYINLLSADDKMKPEALQEYATVLSDRGERDIFIFSDTEHIDGESNLYRYESRDMKTFSSVYFETENYREGKLHITNGHEVLRKSLPLLKNPAPFLSVVVSASLWKKVEGYQATRTIGPDKFFNYKALSTNPEVIYLPKALFQYRVHITANTIAQAGNVKQQIDDYLNILDFSKLAESLQIEPAGMKKVFLERVCFKYAIQALLSKNYEQAVRLRGCMLFFPREAHNNLYYYLLKLLLMLYPLSYHMIKAIQSLRK